ncbi:MAG: hypothetical protein KatS3mg081_0237 [Gemmatimonadales bacterium]|nr:MAG: hypothetical protein KatS3mg081_0237 [Gemmatimonadales bacterium]
MQRVLRKLYLVLALAGAALAAAATLNPDGGHVGINDLCAVECKISEFSTCPGQPWKCNLPQTSPLLERPLPLLWVELGCIDRWRS